MEILKISLMSAILIAVIWLIRTLCMNRLPKITFQLLWCIALVRLLIPVSLPSQISIYNGFGKLITRVFTNEGLTSKWEYFYPNTISNDAIKTTSPSYVQSILGYSIGTWVLFAIWLTGALVLGSILLSSHLKKRREYKMALPTDSPFIKQWRGSLKLLRSVDVLMSDRITAPMIYGVFKPVILLPKYTNWSDETGLEYILTHELIHIKKFDILFKWILTVTLCLYWFHPMVWLMYIVANRDLEIICDNLVLKYLGIKNRSIYALYLIYLEERKSGISPLTSEFSRNASKERIGIIMKSKKMTFTGVFMAMCLIFGTIAFFATNSLAEESAEKKDTTLASTESQKALSNLEESPAPDSIVSEQEIDGDVIGIAINKEIAPISLPDYVQKEDQRIQDLADRGVITQEEADQQIADHQTLLADVGTTNSFLGTTENGEPVIISLTPNMEQSEQ